MRVKMMREGTLSFIKVLVTGHTENDGIAEIVCPGRDCGERAAVVCGVVQSHAAGAGECDMSGVQLADADVPGPLDALGAMLRGEECR